MKQNTDRKTSTGTYTVQATCPGCLPYVNTVNFTETGVGMELTCVSCEWHWTAGEELRNPFRLRVLDKSTGEPIAGAAVTYMVIRFTDKNGNTSSNVHGADKRVFNGVTDIYGFSRAYLDLGSEEGTYVVQARCETCLGGQEQIAQVIVQNYKITPEVETVVAADPNLNEADCPSGCCPPTPVIRTKMAAGPNDGSFTSDNRENLIGLNVSVLPACLKEQTAVSWQVADAPGDFIESMSSSHPIPQPTPGPVSSFRVFQDNLPGALQGRPLPLAYKVTASITRNNLTHTANAVVRQDEIDKCRQEYIDWETPPPHDLRNQLSNAPRTEFRLGIAGDFGKYTDCYANIYPTQEAQVAFNLRNAGYSLNINSGYRSPRYNMLTVHSSTSSPHLFGDAVDITPTDTSPAGWQALWEAPEATCPKVLEYNKHDTILFCRSDGVMRRGSAFPSDAESNNDPLVFSIHKNCIHLGELKH